MPAPKPPSSEKPCGQAGLAVDRLDQLQDGRLPRVRGGIERKELRRTRRHGPQLQIVQRRVPGLGEFPGVAVHHRRAEALQLARDIGGLRAPAEDPLLGLQLGRHLCQPRQEIVVKAGIGEGGGHGQFVQRAPVQRLEDKLGVRPGTQADIEGLGLLRATAAHDQQPGLVL